MEKLIKKNRKEPIKNRYAFPTTDDQKTRLDELKDIKGYDVNEMFRQYADKIIEKAEQEEDKSA